MSIQLGWVGAARGADFFDAADLAAELFFAADIACLLYALKSVALEWRCVWEMLEGSGRGRRCARRRGAGDGGGTEERATDAAPRSGKNAWEHQLGCTYFSRALLIPTATAATEEVVPDVFEGDHANANDIRMPSAPAYKLSSSDRGALPHSLRPSRSFFPRPFFWSRRPRFFVLSAHSSHYRPQSSSFSFLTV